MIGMGGNPGAILSSRLSTRLHLGYSSSTLETRVLWTNIFAILGLAVTIFSALGIAAWVVGQVIAEPMALVDLMLISVVSGMLLAVIAIALSLGATYVSLHAGAGPRRYDDPGRHEPLRYSRRHRPLGGRDRRPELRSNSPVRDETNSDVPETRVSVVSRFAREGPFFRRIFTL